MLKFLRSTVVYVGFLAAASLAIAPQLKAQSASTPIQVAYSKLDVNAVNLYYSDPDETVESSDLEEAVDLDSISDEAMSDDSSEESTSLH